MSQPKRVSQGRENQRLKWTKASMCQELLYVQEDPHHFEASPQSTYGKQDGRKVVPKFTHFSPEIYKNHLESYWEENDTPVYAWSPINPEGIEI